VPRHVARLVVDYFDYAAYSVASARRAARRTARHRLLRLAPLIVDYFASRRLVANYFTYAVRSVASTRHAACRVTHRRLLCLAQARRQLLRLRRASGCLGTSRGSSRGSSSTTSPPPRVQVPQHVTRLVVDYFNYAACLVTSAHRAARRTARRSARRRLLRLAPLIVDYFASRRLVVDYFAYAVRLGASACRATHHAARRRLLRLTQARRRLLHLRGAFGCLGTSRRSSSTSSPTLRVRVPRHIAPLVVDYLAYAVRPGASARAARRRLPRLRGASGCLGSSRRSPSTTSPTPHVRVPRHVAWLISSLVVDYFASAARPGASARHTARHAARRRLLHVPRLPLAATLALLQPRCASHLLVLRQHWLYFGYAVRRHDVVFRSHRVDHSSRLVFQTSREWQSRPQQLVGINSD
jgi:hypothetical protein